MNLKRSVVVDESKMLTRTLKRVQMQLDFQRTTLERAVLPDGFVFRMWNPSQLPEHAAVKCASFRGELDSCLFPSLATYTGCEELMRSISVHPGFLPQATWLIEYQGTDFSGAVPCGTIQGITRNSTLGSIQNVGVIPEFRGQGLGRALLLKSLVGFRRDGMLKVALEVTAENTPAVELYRSLGFEAMSTSIRELPRPIEIS